MRFINFLNENSEYDGIWEFTKAYFEQAKDLKELSRLRKEAGKRADAGEPKWKWGPIVKYSKEKREQLKEKLGIMGKQSTAAESRMDRLLRIRDSSGKATARKFK